MNYQFFIVHPIHAKQNKMASPTYESLHLRSCQHYITFVEDNAKEDECAWSWNMVLIALASIASPT